MDLQTGHQLSVAGGSNVNCDRGTTSVVFSQCVDY
jgi:hypothetical protein